MRKIRTVNIDPFHCEVTVSSDGFVLTFNGHGDKKVNIKMGYWWVQYIASELWKCVRKQKAMAENNENALKGD